MGGLCGEAPAKFGLVQAHCTGLQAELLRELSLAPSFAPKVGKHQLAHCHNQTKKWITKSQIAP